MAVFARPLRSFWLSAPGELGPSMSLNKLITVSSHQWLCSRQRCTALLSCVRRGGKAGGGSDRVALGWDGMTTTLRVCENNVLADDFGDISSLSWSITF